MEMNMSDEKELVLRELIPIGERVLKILNVELKTSSNGNEMLEWTIMDKETGACDILDTITPQGKRWALKNILKACNVEVLDGEIYKFEISDLIDKIIIGINKHIVEDWINKKGETIQQTKNKFIKFLPYVKKEGEEEIPF